MNIPRALNSSVCYRCSASGLLQIPARATSTSASTAPTKAPSNPKVSTKSITGTRNGNNNVGHDGRQKKENPKYALRVGHRPPSLNDLALAKRFFDKSPTYHAGSASANDEVLETMIPQVAFAGRTNAGKSSLLKALIPEMKIIKPSKKPGFTRKIYFYGVGNKLGRELVLSDLPGYGYGSTTDQGNVILEYIRTAANLKMVYILMDCRVLEMPSDKQVIELLDTYGIPWQIIGTKFDRVTSRDPAPVLDILMRFSKMSRKGAMGASELYYKDEIIVTSDKSMAGISELKWSIMRNCGLVSE
ncbi:P-loop containing nucleoside triphosphate hydrolase protein [Lipomyces tetrasporus]